MQLSNPSSPKVVSVMSCIHMMKREGLPKVSSDFWINNLLQKQKISGINVLPLIKKLCFDHSENRLISLIS